MSHKKLLYVTVTCAFGHVQFMLAHINHQNEKSKLPHRTIKHKLLDHLPTQSIIYIES